MATDAIQMAGGGTRSSADAKQAGASIEPERLRVAPIPAGVAKDLVIGNHYLRTFPGGTKLALGIFVGSRIAGAMTLGVGPMNGHMLVQRAGPEDCLTLTRLCMWGDLPHNAASRALGMATRALKANTDLKFLITYADPARGHRGVIYQASNWTYTGLSEPTPLYDLGDGVARHSRTVGHIYGTHSVRLLRQKGIDATLVPRPPKHRYLFFLDRRWRNRLLVPELPYPKPSSQE